MNNPSIFIFSGIAGSIFVILGTLISAFAYRGKQGETYSPLNHFISELGEIGVSHLAWVFNTGLILCGIILIPACISLGMILPGFLSKLGMFSGVIAAVGLALVGFNLMNKLKPHGKAAVTFFRGGLIMVLSFSLAIAFQPTNRLVIPRMYSLAGLPAILSFGGFLLLMGRSSRLETRGPLQPITDDRPKFWLMPTVEWSIFFTIVLWFLLIAVSLQ
ncbi:MAG: DUF998 domain-containing protein [Brevefilum fermentans]|jgi:hypothetical membrane protein|uniref:DUF998 domain-containing protein n=1 Tax=Candidatus Brevifilum fermentans TaxID=1986204 RepID=A0A1Y6K6J8_9CHLR|nr:DUF998 domain-containing protein [Brevefilum fermentans]MDI9566803.1 DUF998 domain-containing protein [Chloroflexota bacterium]SMX54518.1 membrane protein of unknown function [Brevefilum fermentans]